MTEDCGLLRKQLYLDVKVYMRQPKSLETPASSCAAKKCSTVRNLITRMIAGLVRGLLQDPNRSEI